jgi:Flp pilus assembly protein TadD
MSLLLTALENPARMRNGIPGVEPRLSTADLPSPPTAPPVDSLAIEPMGRSAADNAGRPEDPENGLGDERVSAMAAAHSTRWGMRHRGSQLVVACALLTAIGYGGLLYIDGGNPDWLNHVPWQPSDSRGAISTTPAQFDAITPEDVPVPVDPSAVADASPLRAVEHTTAPTQGRSGPVALEAGAEASHQRPLASQSASQSASTDRARDGTSATDDAAPADPGSVAAQGGDALASIVRSAVLDDDHALRNAWYALAAGNDREALRLYRSALQRSSVRSDAMLGVAAALTHLGLHDQARRHYLTLLEIEPSNAAARSNLLALRIRTGDSPSEQEILDLIDEEPSDFLYAVLGHIRAAGHRWSDAREAFEIALRLQPDGAVHAFNLAVSLEQLGQVEPALGYYRRAASLSDTTVRPEFDRELLARRITVLSHASGN